MPNIKFSYLYRDAANYKNYGEVIFANPDEISIDELDRLIKLKLVDGQWFYAKKWKIPDLHFEKWNEDLDHGFHEFESLSLTNQEINASFPLSHFCELVRESAWKY
jgi:hypothetical protein